MHVVVRHSITHVIMFHHIFSFQREFFQFSQVCSTKTLLDMFHAWGRHVECNSRNTHPPSPSRSETMDLLSPCKRKTLRMYISAVSLAFAVVFVGTKCACFVRRSMNVRIALLPDSVTGKPVIKSIEISSQGLDGTGRHCKGACCGRLPLLCWHFLHDFTNLFTYCDIRGQKNDRARREYDLSRPG